MRIGIFDVFFFFSTGFMFVCLVFMSVKDGDIWLVFGGGKFLYRDGEGRSLGRLC